MVRVFCPPEASAQKRRCCVDLAIEFPDRVSVFNGKMQIKLPFIRCFTARHDKGCCGSMTKVATVWRLFHHLDMLHKIVSSATGSYHWNLWSQGRAAWYTEPVVSHAFAPVWFWDLHGNILADMPVKINQFSVDNLQSFISGGLDLV